MEDAHTKDLLAEILDDGDIVRNRFSPATMPELEHLGDWGRLREELMYRNRFFPDIDINLDKLRRVLPYLVLKTDELPALWYRARIQPGEQSLDLSQMGAPPARIASHGRANPAGIPYLYLASTEKTAVSEIRPHAGEVICVAQFERPEGLSIVDLGSPKDTVSPFQLSDAEEIIRMRGDLPFLERLGQELRRPVVPQAAAIDYTPSQYLCEFIKKCGHDGVVYSSAQGDGLNLALFDPSKADGRMVAQRLVTKVSVHTQDTPSPS